MPPPKQPFFIPCCEVGPSGACARSRASIIAMSSRTVYRLLEEAVSAYGAAPALYEPIPGPEGTTYQTYNWTEYKQAVEEVAVGLRARGISKGDVVAIISETRLEFYLADLGIMTCGGLAAAMYTSYPPREQVRTLKACDARAVFVENPELLRKLRTAAEGSLDVQFFLFQGEAEDAITMERLRQAGASALSEDAELLPRMCGEVAPSDYAILYMTSGATGEPKMALVTHHSIVANLDMGPNAVPLSPDHVSITFLPSAHITQRIAMELLPIRCGMPVYFSEGLSKLPHELKRIQPTFFVAPPRVWERIYSSICTEIRKRGPFTRKLFYGALGLGLEASKLRQQRKPIPAWMGTALRAADRLVFQKIRERFGGRLELPISGSAPLPKDLADFYSAIGMPIFEGYGLTEGGIVCLNPLDHVKSGSIGVPFTGVEFKIAEDGELLIRSASLFSGYYKDPGSTASVLRDGWLHTGDVAERDSEGYYYITGRKKDLLVASNGKKIFPARIENMFKMEPIFNQVYLLGDRMPYVAAIFTLNATAAEALKGMENYRGKPVEEVVQAPVVTEEIKKAVARVNRQLAPFEQVRRYHLLNREFTIADGELTPTMKLRRAKILENHRNIVQALFAGKEEWA